MEKGKSSILFNFILSYISNQYDKNTCQLKENAVYLEKKALRFDYSGRKLVIATRHGKERALDHLLRQHLGVKCIVSTELDTDALGSFSGEIERKLSPLECTRAKCLKAIEMYHCSLAIASEGSFAPHPAMPWIAADEELLLFMDIDNGFEIQANVLSIETNYGQKEIANWKELEEFAQKHLFPSHALILKSGRNSFGSIIKGIDNWNDLRLAFNQLMLNSGELWVETDMRAMNNPSRMAVIRQCGEVLLNKIASRCPACQAPGFSIVERISGLPCQQCGMPTPSIIQFRYKCQLCTKEVVKKNPDKAQENPQYCNFCNP